MIKGVNRKVIEINRTDSDYFERAVLYLKPDVNEASLQAAQLETQTLLGQASRRRVSGWVWFLMGVAASGGVYFLIMLLKG